MRNKGSNEKEDIGEEYNRQLIKVKRSNDLKVR